MSYSGIIYAMNENYLSDNLRIYYDFTTGNIQSANTGVWSSYVKNLAYTGSEVMNGYVLGATSTVELISNILGRQFIIGEAGDMAKRNMLVTGLNSATGIALNDCSSIIAFENSGSYNDGILFGSLKPKIDSYNGENYYSYEGLNFGITKRGHLFLQSYSPDGPHIHVATSIELSQKNIVSFSVGNNEGSIARYDFLNQEIQSETFLLDTNTIYTPTNFYLGGSPTYFRSSSANDKTFSGKIDEFALFSGVISNQALFEIASGMVGDYYYNTGSITLTTGVTGTSITAIYGTGITGYTTSITGYRLIPTGTVVDDVLTPLTASGQYEGYRYLSAQDGALEEQGFLSANYFGTYQPIGDSAFATLGLQYASGAITGYYIQRQTQILYGSEPLYLETPLTGFTSDITGYLETQLTGILYSEESGASSGVMITGSASPYKKNFIHFLGNDI
jgi:hypothetical protein